MKHSVTPNLSNLENKLQVFFSNRNLLRQALTHRSFSSKNNERLEFLGDALLQAFSSILIYDNYPELSEGDLSRIRASVVREKTLADLARRFDLGEYLFLGQGEKKTGGYRRDSILSDALEAVIAAIYLDKGIDICRNFIKTNFIRYVKQNSDPQRLKDAKTRLQEYLQSRSLALPHYEMSSSGPAHDLVFYIRATSGDFVAEASASNRKTAEQIAAQKLLDFYGV